ncbi:MAG: hypothetical protein FWG11_06680 [Promicromonosporaceae bacterium]|nr:hypothetical protein [Promicromonosporaceae bacterium]
MDSTSNPRSPAKWETMSDVLAFASALPFVADIEEEVIVGSLRHFAQITEPEEVYEMKFISLSSSGGVSRKPGNIVLNWRKLFDTGPDIAVALAGMAGQGAWVRGLIGLYVWNKFWRASEEPLTEEEASVIEALWVTRSGKSVPADDAFARVNAEREKRGCSALTRGVFEQALNRLASMQCIELEDASIWLREWVRRAT